MFELRFFASILLLVFAFLAAFVFYIKHKLISRSKSISSTTFNSPSIYPFIGSYGAIYKNRKRLNQWFADILRNTPTGTYVLHWPFGTKQIITADPAVVKHILSTQFPLYTKGDSLRNTLHDFLGTGIVNTDGDNWKFQRTISVNEFNTNSLRTFIENVVKTELIDRLIPILSTAAADNTVLDLQDILQRFAFDNICKIAFGFDPESLLPSRPKADFSTAFERANGLSFKRLGSLSPLFWKLNRFLGLGSEKQLGQAISKVRRFAKKIIAQKKHEVKERSSLEATDLLSRFLNSGHFDENALIDIVLSFILAGQDSTSAALTWFFYLISCNSNVEDQILKEIMSIVPEIPGYNDVKNMVYTHASLFESMRLYPPVPADTKQVIEDDILPDGTVMKKGMQITYHPYAMGRMENLWGKDCMEFNPERWLKRDRETGELSFVQRDSFTYPVFQAGPRICVGKEMALLQMKMLVAGILGPFRVVPAMGNDFAPVYISNSKMKGGFPVRIALRK